MKIRTLECITDIDGDGILNDVANKVLTEHVAKLSCINLSRKSKHCFEFYCYEFEVYN